MKKSIEVYLLEMVQDWRDTDVDEWRYHWGKEQLKKREDVLWYCSNILEEFIHTHPEMKDFEI